MILDLLDKISTALNSDKNIQDFCLEQFDKKQHIFVGQDPEKQCSKDDMPAIILGGIEGGKASDTTREKKISIGIFISNETDAETDKDGITKYDGFYQCEGLAELVETCLLSMNYKCNVEYRPLQSEKFPIFSASMIFTIEKVWPLRGVK